MKLWIVILLFIIPITVNANCLDDLDKKMDLPLEYVTKRPWPLLHTDDLDYAKKALEVKILIQKLQILRRSNERSREIHSTDEE
jgi:hypothetical protein